MKDRIQVDGVWYVREKNQTFKIYESEQLEIDQAAFTMTADRMKDDDGGYYEPSITVKYKDGREMDIWDNESWLVGIADRNEESLGLIDADTEQACIALCDKMRELGWI